MKEEDLRLIASLVDWSDKLMAKVFYETYGKVLQEKFAEYEECKQELKDCVQRNFGNAKVPKTPRRMNPAAKLLEQIQQFKIMNFDSDDEDDSVLVQRPQPSLAKIPLQILQQLQNIELQQPSSNTNIGLKLKENKENADTPRLNMNQNFMKNMDENHTAETLKEQVYDFPASNNLDKTPKLRKIKAPVTGHALKNKVLNTFKKEEQIKRLEEKANLALKHREEILKDKAERARRDREERQRRVEENNRLKEMQQQERERQQRYQEERLRKFRQEQEDQDRLIRSPAAKTRKMGTPKALRTVTSTTSINSVPINYLCSEAPKMIDERTDKPESIGNVEVPVEGYSEVTAISSEFSTTPPVEKGQIESMDDEEEESPHFRPANEAEFLQSSSALISAQPTVIYTPHFSSKIAQQSSYEITPDKVHLPSTKDNYVIDDLSSADETDNEEAPRKEIPRWAQKPLLMRKVTTLRQLLTEEQRERHFGRMAQPNVNEFFIKYRKEYPLRSSSAVWNSPIFL